MRDGYPAAHALFRNRHSRRAFQITQRSQKLVRAPEGVVVSLASVSAIVEEAVLGALVADQFAAALLMPVKLFTAAMIRTGEGLQAIETLAGDCGTSLEATAIRYAQTNSDPVAVVRSDGRTIDYAFMSEALKDFPGLDWIRKGTLLPANCVTATFNADKSNAERAARAKGTSTLQDWFNGPHRQEVVEEVVGLGSYGKTLTVLTEMESPDEFEDEDGELEESWTPRFHR